MKRRQNLALKEKSTFNKLAIHDYFSQKERVWTVVSQSGLAML